MRYALEPHGLVRDDDATGCQHILDHTQLSGNLK